MSTLPIYHPVPADEKHPISATLVDGEFDPRYIHPAAIGSQYLYIGGPRSAYQAAKDKYAGLSKVKKGLLALAVVWFGLVVGHQAARLAGGKCHQDAHHAPAEFGVKQWRDHSSHRFGGPIFLEDGPLDCHGGRKDRAPEEVSFFPALER